MSKESQFHTLTEQWRQYFNDCEKEDLEIIERFHGVLAIPKIKDAMKSISYFGPLPASVRRDYFVEVLEWRLRVG